MRTSISARLLMLLVAALLARVSFGTYKPGKAAQINYYTDSACRNYVGEAAEWWTTKGPEITECMSLNMPHNAQSINTAAIWKPDGTPYCGKCIFYEAAGCGSGQFEVSSYSPYTGQCLSARTVGAATLWQSAKCSVESNAC
ncbi:hypothetical protein MVEN_01988200 [Mycena venus]|uniref:Uncharacterized protein n=1 Tax=Mycena venus TaxID=2733690 RepID=A0A8H7CIV5_9AGAR|nr:hypothetical protein MVEN_01988200 [Mycena venus]